MPIDVHQKKRAFHFDDMVQQGGIVTATVKETGIKIGMPITFATSNNEVLECVVIKKLGKQIKLRVEKIAVKKVPAMP